MADEDKTVIADLRTLNRALASPQKAVACLVQYSGEQLGKRYTLVEPEVKVGRSAEAQITLAEASVSRLHACITQKDGVISLADLGSANGTFVNDQKVTTAVVLRDQDMVRLGAVHLKFFSSDNVDGYVQDKIYRMATTDAGTKIFNKMYLLESLEAELRQSLASGRPLSLIYYDLDHFKKVNDTFGHNAGDRVLYDSAQLVKAVLRKDDILGRFGGEEFIIILPNTDQKTAVELAERVRKACENHVFPLELVSEGLKKSVAHRQTFSLGIAQALPTMKTPKDLLEAADKKLYASKQNGRNRVTF